MRVSGVLAVLREHPRRRSLDQVVDAFLADCRARNLSPRTLEHYDSAIRSFRATLAAPSAAHVLADLEPAAARAWIAVLQRTRRPVSVQSAVRGLKVLGHWVAREGYAGADPLATVRLPKAPPPLILPLSGDQVAALMAAGSPVLRVAVALLADTGMRASELCGLAVDDVREGFLRILAKGGRERPAQGLAVTGRVSHDEQGNEHRDQSANRGPIRPLPHTLGDPGHGLHRDSRAVLGSAAAPSPTARVRRESGGREVSPATRSPPAVRRVPPTCTARDPRRRPGRPRTIRRNRA